MNLPLSSVLIGFIQILLTDATTAERAKIVAESRELKVSADSVFERPTKWTEARSKARGMQFVSSQV